LTKCFQETYLGF